MYPVIKLFSVVIDTYTLFYIIAAISAVLLLRSEFKRNHYDPRLYIVVSLTSLFAGLIGGKLYYCLEEWHEFIKKLEVLGKRINDAQKEYEILATTRRRQLESPLEKLENLRSEQQLLGLNKLENFNTSGSDLNSEDDSDSNSRAEELQIVEGQSSKKVEIS